MILQTKASTLAVLMAKDVGKCPYLNALHDAVILARDETRIVSGPLPCDADVSNDRTTLEIQKKKDILI